MRDWISQVHRDVVVTAFLLVASTASAAEFKLSCIGNIETYDKKILQTNVTYLLWYEISDSKAIIRFAGREFDASVEEGKSWKGFWIKSIKDDNYFSFLPDEGGTVKFEFEKNKWFSGNCRE